jgi:hypothetical protein
MPTSPTGGNFLLPFVGLFCYPQTQKNTELPPVGSKKGVYKWQFLSLSAPRRSPDLKLPKFKFKSEGLDSGKETK